MRIRENDCNLRLKLSDTGDFLLNVKFLRGKNFDTKRKIRTKNGKSMRDKEGKLHFHMLIFLEYTHSP